MRFLDAELRKAHRRHDLALCLLVPLIAIAWAGGAAPGSQEELAQGYRSLFYSLPILHAIVLPVTMALLASRLWDLEIKGCTRSLLYTLQSRRSLFTAKAVLGLLEILLITLLELAAAVLLGKRCGYTDAAEPGQLVYLFLSLHTVCEWNAVLFGVFGNASEFRPAGRPLRGHCGGYARHFFRFPAQNLQLFYSLGLLCPSERL